MSERRREEQMQEDRLEEEQDVKMMSLFRRDWAEKRKRRVWILGGPVCRWH